MATPAESARSRDAVEPQTETLYRLAVAYVAYKAATAVDPIDVAEFVADFVAEVEAAAVEMAVGAAAWQPLNRAALALAHALINSAPARYGGTVNVPGDANALATELAPQIAERAVRDAGEHYNTIAERVRRSNPEATPDDVVAEFTKDTPWQRAVARTVATRQAAETALSMVDEVDADAGEKHRVVWISRGDHRVRDSHRKLHGKIRAPGKAFKVWSDGKRLAYPGDPRAPLEETINCVVGSTEVAWPGQSVLAATRRESSGTFVHLLTADGHDLTVTPNHPVLTPLGYVPAGALRPGDDVLAADLTVTPQVADRPPSIEEVYRAARQMGSEQRVGRSRVNFHGDVPVEEVHVVWTDGDLTAELRGERSQQRLVGANVPAGQGGALRRVERPWVVRTDFQAALDEIRARRGIRSSGETPAFGRSHAGETQPVGLTATARGDAQLGQSPDDDVATDAERLRHLQDAFASAVTAENLIQGDVNPPSVSDGLSPRPHRQSHFVQRADDRTVADAELARHLGDAQSFGMKPSKLVLVDVHTAVHQVYNLHTSAGWYTGNGIACHNCRCGLILVPESSMWKGLDIFRVSDEDFLVGAASSPALTQAEVDLHCELAR